MADAASAWLMTNLSADPRTVAMVQVANYLPMFLFTIPAGTLADLVEPRRFLIGLEFFITVFILLLAATVYFHWATPNLLLAMTFILSGSWSVAAPAWGSITSKLVPRNDLDSATAANSVSYHAGRAIGSTLGGRLIAAFGAAMPYWFFALANAGTIAALIWWRAPEQRNRGLPAERFISAVRTGLRHAVFNSHLRATLARTMAIFPFGAAYLALLPLVARHQMTSGPQFYGLLLAIVSIGAVFGSLLLPFAKRRLGPDRLVAAATVGMALALVLFGRSHIAATAMLAAFLAGGSWTVMLAELYVSAQVALPDWVRGRGLAIFLTVVFGSVTFGSAVWGYAAAHFGLPSAHYLAAAGAMAAIPLSWRWKLQTGEAVDLSPSMHWRAPMLAKTIRYDNGPVLVTVRYRILGDDPDPFLDAIEVVGRQRQRDGAFAWGIFADVAEKGVYLETFLLETWLETQYLRERVTNSDREVEEHVIELLSEPRELTLMIAADAEHATRFGAEAAPARREPRLTNVETTA